MHAQALARIWKSAVIAACGPHGGQEENRILPDQIRIFAEALIRTQIPSSCSAGRSAVWSVSVPLRSTPRAAGAQRLCIP